jgi:hypothetical protein
LYTFAPPPALAIAPPAFAIALLDAAVLGAGDAAGDEAVVVVVVVEELLFLPPEQAVAAMVIAATVSTTETVFFMPDSFHETPLFGARSTSATITIPLDESGSFDGGRRLRRHTKRTRAHRPCERHQKKIRDERAASIRYERQSNPRQGK